VIGVTALVAVDLIELDAQRADGGNRYRGERVEREFDGSEAGVP
jgi:hypothetical protein